MRNILSEHIVTISSFAFQQPWRSLIGSFKGDKILLATPLLKWYLQHGLVVTKVHQTIEFERNACFEKFAKEVSDARLVNILSAFAHYMFVLKTKH